MANVRWRIRAASMFLLTMLAIMPQVFAQNLSNYKGAVSVTGNQSGGIDSISHVNWNSVIDPRTYGAKCDGSTDDTSTFNSAIASGHAIEIPQGSVCKIATSLIVDTVNGMTIFGQSRKETMSGDGSPKTGLKFTGTPSTCSSGNGGLLTIRNSYSVTLRDMDIWFDAAGVPADCGLYIYNSSRIMLERLHITNPGSTGGTPVATTAIQWEQSTNSSVNYNIVDAGFARMIWSPAVSGNYLNVSTIIGNRFAPPPIAYEYLPLVDIETGSPGGVPQNLVIQGNAFEQAPQGLKITNGGLANEISSNYMADGFGENGTWQASHTYNPATTGGCIYATVSGTNYEFCPSQTRGTCTSGSLMPSWSATLGSTTHDNTCTWYNEGQGIAMEINQSGGSIHDNLIALSTLVGLRLDPGDVGTNVYANRFGYGLRDELEAYGNAQHIGTNRLDATSSAPVQTTMIRIGGANALCTASSTPFSCCTGSGAGTCTSYANEVDTQYFSDTSTNPVPFLTLSAGSSGAAMYDTTLFPSSRISNLSSGGWAVRDPNNQVTVSGFAPALYYSAAGTALSACSSKLARQFECVSDSTACISGTTYASGGSTACLVQCNNAGTAWKETGISCF